MSLPFDELPAAYGHVEHTDFISGTLQGHIFVPRRALDSVHVYVNGVHAGEGPLESRSDISDRFQFTSFAPLGRTGYRIELKAGCLTDGVHRVMIVGCDAVQSVCRMRSIVFPPSQVPDIPVPPPGLIELTQGDHDATMYKHLGFRYFHQLRDVIARHRDLRAMRCMLDWGCGSGRLASYFLAEPEGPQVFGGDYDHWAADWCRLHLPRGEFRALGPLPPLPYPDAHFNLIVAMGVVGGCGKAEWAVWLPELYRVLSPHGLLLMTIQGVFAATVLYPSQAIEQLRHDGFFDGTAYDAAWPPAADDKRYRGGTYLTHDYILKSWSPYFRILEHLEGEINSDLDLIAAERKT